MTENNIQLDHNHQLKHFLAIEGLPRSLLETILDQAESFSSVADRAVKKYHYCAVKLSLTYFLNPVHEPGLPLKSQPNAFRPMY